MEVVIRARLFQVHLGPFFGPTVMDQERALMVTRTPGATRKDLRKVIDTGGLLAFGVVGQVVAGGTSFAAGEDAVLFPDGEGAADGIA